MGIVTSIATSPSPSLSSSSSSSSSHSLGPFVSKSSGSTSLLTSCLEQIVKEGNEANFTIYSYTGDERHTPIYYEEILLFKKMIEKANLCWKVVEVSDTTFSPSTWDPRKSVIHIPGGRSSDIDDHLGTKVKEIREFVNQGGRFLGWCGGGYWACREVQYRLDEHSTLRKIRELALWKGIQKGPRLPFLGTPEKHVEFFHGAVKVKWKGSETLKKYFPEGLELNVLLSGGGSFIPAADEHRYKVLANYEDSTFAGVKTNVGDGIAVLINPYFTYGVDYLKKGLEEFMKHAPAHNWVKIVEAIEGEDLKSMLCFADMLLDMTHK